MDGAHWQGRLAQARSFLEAAQQAALLADPDQNGNPIVSHVVTAAIAYADALTAKRTGVVNRQAHAAAPKLLREILRASLPKQSVIGPIWIQRNTIAPCRRSTPERVA